MQPTLGSPMAAHVEWLQLFRGQQVWKNAIGTGHIENAL